MIVMLYAVTKHFIKILLVSKEIYGNKSQKELPPRDQTREITTKGHPYLVIKACILFGAAVSTSINSCDNSLN